MTTYYLYVCSRAASGHVIVRIDQYGIANCSQSRVVVVVVARKRVLELRHGYSQRDMLWAEDCANVRSARPGLSRTVASEYLGVSCTNGA